MLDEAGWIEGAGGWRFCDHCGTAEDGTSLQINLGSDSDLYSLSAQISDQWEQMGIQVYLSGDSRAELLGESFDAYFMCELAAMPTRMPTRIGRGC